MDKIDLAQTNRLISVGIKDIVSLIGIWSIISYARFEYPNFNIFELYLPRKKRYLSISFNNFLFGLGMVTNFFVINRYLDKGNLPQFHHLNFWFTKPVR